MSLVTLPIRITWWVVSTFVMGLSTFARAVRLAMRLPLMLSETASCPRGHEVPLFGVFECGTCRATSEMYVFAKCAVCGERAGWTNCPTCQLPIRSPFV